LTIGSLAEATGMSKSGLFAHFGSREELQVAVLKHGEARFAETVLRPALTAPRGLARLRAMFVNWLDWAHSSELPGGCPMLAASSEFDDRPGPVREQLARGQREWIAALKLGVALAIEAGELARGTDPEQLVFEMYGISLATHHYRRLLGHTGARERALAALEELFGAHSAANATRHTRPARAANR
jgi:AcrR family transcriptional regulator